MPLCQLNEPGQYCGAHVECDYCPADAVWHHFASPSNADRDAYACDARVSLLNRNYQMAV
ncbi:hypothetical protein [Mycobacterium sp.]|uniref:hypothetical protein n=1 Tax=Mycobacterium sp. TaxID=1785 RepID=UPI003F963C26